MHKVEGSGNVKERVVTNLPLVGLLTFPRAISLETKEVWAERAHCSMD